MLLMTRAFRWMRHLALTAKALKCHVDVDERLRRLLQRRALQAWPVTAPQTQHVQTRHLELLTVKMVSTAPQRRTAKAQVKVRQSHQPFGYWQGRMGAVWLGRTLLHCRGASSTHHWLVDVMMQHGERQGERKMLQHGQLQHRSP